MVLQPKPIRERVERRVAHLQELAADAKQRAVISAGLLAVDAAVVAGSIATERPFIAVTCSIAGVVMSAVCVASGIESIARSNQAASLEGALAQHELAAMPFEPSQPSRFLGQSAEI